MGFLFFSFVKILKALDKDHFNKVEKKLDHVFLEIWRGTKSDTRS